MHIRPNEHGLSTRLLAQKVKVRELILKNHSVTCYVGDTKEFELLS